jgi:hypothetical protein
MRHNSRFVKKPQWFPRFSTLSMRRSCEKNVNQR